MPIAFSRAEPISSPSLFLSCSLSRNTIVLLFTIFTLSVFFFIFIIFFFVFCLSFAFPFCLVVCLKCTYISIVSYPFHICLLSASLISRYIFLYLAVTRLRSNTEADIILTNILHFVWNLYNYVEITFLVFMFLFCFFLITGRFFHR